MATFHHRIKSGKKGTAAAVEVDAKFPVPGKSLVEGAGKEPRRGPQPAPEAQRQRAQHNELKEQDRDRKRDVDADR